MAVAYIIREGRRWSPSMWECVQTWRRLARAEGIPFTITQGGFNAGGVAASAGTHDGDAVDISVSGLSRSQVTRLVELGRMVGLAAWFRTTKTAKWGTRAQGFGSYHIHAVPNGWGLPSTGARSQATSYRSGRDGLASNQADLGPGHVSAYRSRTWPAYVALDKPGLPSSGVNNTTKPAPTKPAPQEDVMATKEELAQIVQQQVKAALIDYNEKQNRFLDRTADGDPARATSHFTVQGHAAAVAAARNSAAVLGRVAALETALAALASGRNIDKATLTEIADAAEDGVRRGLEGAVVTVELGG